MIKSIFTLVIFLLLVVGCGHPENTQNDISDTIRIYEDNTKATFVKTSDNEGLLSFEFLIKNQTEERLGPFYFKFVFNGQLLHEYLGVKEHTSKLQNEINGIVLDQNDVFQGGDNLQIMTDIDGLIPLLEEQNNSIQFQVVDVNSNEILASQLIHDFKFEDVNTQPTAN